MEKLTKKENEIMELVAKGYSNAEISKKLFISVATIKSHLSHVYLKYSIAAPKGTTQHTTRIRSVLIFLGLAKVEDWLDGK